MDYGGVRELIYVGVFILNNILREFGLLRPEKPLFDVNEFAEELECPPKN
jgi:hypothetical protein